MSDIVNIKTIRAFDLPNNQAIRTLEQLGITMQKTSTMAIVLPQSFKVSLSKLKSCLDTYNQEHKDSFITFVTRGIRLYTLVKY